MSSAVAQTLAKSEFRLGLITRHASESYFGVALLVFLDAVCPVFPGETTLNAASTLAVRGNSTWGW
jgi:hypothetical protein